LIRPDGTSSELQAEGAVLGQFPQWAYRQSEQKMGTGDQLLLFTDGLVEACNVNDEPFGEEALVHVAQKHSPSAQQSMRSLMQAVSQHCGGHFQDDASLIVVKTRMA
jgi:serine phosphatase RsbU (regulator of sigma subunit)